MEKAEEKEKDKEIEHLKAMIQSLQKELYDTKKSQMPASEMQTSSIAHPQSRKDVSSFKLYFPFSNQN